MPDRLEKTSHIFSTPPFFQLTTIGRRPPLHRQERAPGEECARLRRRDKSPAPRGLQEQRRLIGAPVRTMMLWHLSGGQARPAGELAFYANISAQNASAHLARLVEAGLLTVEARGRHRYFRIASPEVAHVIEALAALTPTSNEMSANKLAQLPRGQTPDLKYARTCDDHLAGRTAVEICAALKNNRYLVASSQGGEGSEGGEGFEVTPEGEMWFRKLGIEISNLRGQRRAFARQCLDWSEPLWRLLVTALRCLLPRLNFA